MTKRALSHDFKPRMTSEVKLVSPGVSSMITPVFFHLKLCRALKIEDWRLISSGSKSKTVLPSSTLPSLVVALALNKKASPRDVFPAPDCDMMITSFKFSVRNFLIDPPINQNL